MKHKDVTGLAAVLAAFGMVLPIWKKPKAQVRREATGREPQARPVRARRPEGIDEQARQLQLEHAKLNRTRPGSRKLCVNIKKLRARLREAAAAETESTEQFDPMAAYKAA